MDKLRDVNGDPITAANNRIEFEIVVNGGAPEVRTVSFDIVDGEAEVKTSLGLSEGNVVEIHRLDLFDSNSDRFATLGVRIQNPKP